MKDSKFTQFKVNSNSIITTKDYLHYKPNYSTKVHFYLNLLKQEMLIFSDHTNEEATVKYSLVIEPFLFDQYLALSLNNGISFYISLEQRRWINVLFIGYPEMLPYLNIE